MPHARLAKLYSRFEEAVAGTLAPDVRANVHVELTSSLVYGPFHAALLYVPVVLERLGASTTMIAVYQAQTYLGFLFTMFAGRIIPAGRAQKILGVLWGVGRAAFLFTAFSSNPRDLLLLSAVFWFFDAFLSPAYTRVLQSIYPASVRGRALGYVRLGLAVGMLVATPLWGWVLDHLGHQIMYPIAAVFGVASALMFTRIRLGSDGSVGAVAVTPKTNMWDIPRRDRRYTLYLLSVIAFGFAGLIPSGFYPAVLVDRLHLSYVEVGLLSTAQSVFWLLGYLVWGRLSDRRSGVWTLRLIYAMLAMVPLSYLFATSGWMMFPAFIASGLSSAGIDIAFQSCTIELADPDRIYDYAALHRTIIGIRGLLGPFTGVWLAAIGTPPPVIFLLAVSLYVISAGVMLHPVFRRAVLREPNFAAKPAESRP